MSETPVVLRIGGVDLTKFIAYKGLKWTRNDLDSDDSGRTTMDGLMHRGRIATKYKLNVKLVDMCQADHEMIEQLIYPEFVEVEVLNHPMFGHTTLIMYSNNSAGTLEDAVTQGGWWVDNTFPLIER